MKIVLTSIICFLYLCQLGKWSVKLNEEDFETKAECLLYLIPFLPAVKWFIKKFREIGK